MDLKTFKAPSATGFYNWLAVVADFAGYRTGVPLKGKSAEEVGAAAKIELRRLERQTGVKIVVVRTDGGGEFSDLAIYLDEQGIIHQVRPPYDSALNGVAERFIRTHNETIHTLLEEAGLAHMYWDHALDYANTVALMTHLRADGTTAYEFYTGRRPSIEKMLPFGLRVYARIVHPPPSSLPATERPRSVPARILSCRPERAGWTILTDTGFVTNVRDVFVYNPDGSLGDALENYSDEGYKADEEEAAFDTLAGAGPAAQGTQAAAAALAPAPLTPAADEQDDSEDDAYQGHLASAAAQDVVEDPLSLSEALAGPDKQHWLAAIARELTTLRKKGTWAEVTVPRGRKTVTTKWVFKRKRDAEGRVTIYKARLVARGFTQVKGLDFEETFVPVSRLASLRILLAHAAAHDLHLRQADVEGAYLNGPLEEEVYLAVPDGYDRALPRGTGLRLNKALYGLKQSGHAWWLELDRVLSTLGFKRVPNEWGLYTRADAAATAAPSLSYILVYVDDLLIATRSAADADAILASLGAHWPVTDLGEPTQILSLKVTRNRPARSIALSCRAYLEQVAAAYNLDAVQVGKTAPLPSTGERHLQPAEMGGKHALAPLSPAAKSAYQAMVGKALWIAMTVRPDLAYAAGVLGRVTHAPTELAFNLARRVLAHAYRTRDFSLRLGGKYAAAEAQLRIYCDADWAGEPHSSLSTSGYVAFLYNSPVSWASRRQKSVAPSTTAAEYVAASEAVRETLYLRQLLEYLDIGTPSLRLPTPILLDSLSAIRIGEKPVNFPLAKHINVRHHFVREHVV